MDSTTSMLCERPKVHFGGTQEWTFQDTETQLSKNSVTKEMTKENDGPNDYSIFKGKVFSGYLLKEYTTGEGLVEAYGQDALDTLGEYLERDLDLVIEHITLHGKYASYYMDYRFEKKHLSHLNLLKGILHLINLQSRMNNLLDQVVQGHFAA